MFEREKEDIDNRVISKEEADEIKRKARYNDEGDEAIADFTYDSMLGEDEEDEYRD